jgi:cell division septation protein DedD
MRDLEQIQERDSGTTGRNLGTIVMASLTLVGVTFAMGVVIGQAAEPTAASNPDPLASLDGHTTTAASTPAPTVTPTDPGVDARDLTFPTALTGQEERPEVLAAIAAAAAEEARMEAPVAAAPEALVEELQVALPAEPIIAAAEVAATPPAAVAAGRTQRHLVETARHDPLVAAALPRGPSTATAPRGSEGEYTLQVISYDQPAAANEFADALRARGHEAFVVSADVPDRGRYYRVRIGPFETKYKADAYRAQFETQERMNTFVVKRPKEGEL